MEVELCNTQLLEACKLFYWLRLNREKKLLYRLLLWHSKIIDWRLGKRWWRWRWNSILNRSSQWGLLHQSLLHLGHYHCHLAYCLEQGSHILIGLSYVLVCVALLLNEMANFLMPSARTSIAYCHEVASEVACLKHA